MTIVIRRKWHWLEVVIFLEWNYRDRIPKYRDMTREQFVSAVRETGLYPDI